MGPDPSEWSRKKGAQLIVHRELRPFLNAQFPAIHLAVDIEKRVAIDKLIYSGSFQDTHKGVAAVKPYLHSLSWEEVQEIFEAGLANNQIAWIGTDSDVNDFIEL